VAQPAIDDEWVPSAPDSAARAGLDPDLIDLLRSLVTHIRSGHLTPILGLGLTDGLIGSRKRLARQWAQTFEFPMARHLQDDLPHVAQFVTVMTDPDTLLSSLRDYLRERLQQRYPDLTPSGAEWQQGELVLRAWEQYKAANPAEPHSVLARLPCPVYVTTHPADLLGEALALEGRTPEIVVCRWRQDVYDWPESVFDREPDYVPSPSRPLVFHVFGRLDVPESLVLTEDDHFDFLARVSSDPTLVPVSVSRALADSALLFLGFGLEDWDVRILLRSLISQEGARRLQKYTHVAAQIDLDQSVLSPARARRYLERDFGRFRRPSIDIFWGSVEAFASGLNEVWTSAR
jgi:SIR2-like protein